MYCKPNLLQAYLNNGDALVVLWSAAPVIQAWPKLVMIVEHCFKIHVLQTTASAHLYRQ